jgi:hypothetical protein
MLMNTLLNQIFISEHSCCLQVYYRQPYSEHLHLLLLSYNPKLKYRKKLLNIVHGQV